MKEHWYDASKKIICTFNMKDLNSLKRDADCNQHYKRLVERDSKF